MLLNRKTLDAIVASDVDLVFRRWKRATVKTGGTLRTRAGMLAIVAVDPITIAQVTPDEARRAGYRTKAELVDSLRGRSGRLYRVTVALGGEDPLVALRSDPEITPDQFSDIRSRLERMDRADAAGPWTRRYLEILREHPHVRAEDLAHSIGLDKPPFKNNIRKLKKFGLTISHSPGYELSPRGAAFLTMLEHAEPADRT